MKFTTTELQTMLDLVNLELSNLYRMDRSTNDGALIKKQIATLEALKQKIKGAR
jgi:hypothetical protein